MKIHHITARLIDDRVEVSGPDKLFFVSPRNETHGYSCCPIDYLAGALGS